MTKKIQQFSYSILCFMISFSLFAIPPGDENDTGDLEGPEPTAAPINTKLIFLTIAGVIYAFYYFKKSKNKPSVNLK